MGAGATGRVWHLHQVPALVDAGYRVITFDNRGISPAEPGFTVDDLVADTAGLIEHLGLGRCRLVGTSMGAQVVAELALSRPDLVSQAVLMATRGRPDVMRAAMGRAEKELLDSGVTIPPRQEAVDRALRNLSPHTLNADAAISDWLDVFEMSPVLWTPGLRATRSRPPARIEPPDRLRGHPSALSRDRFRGRSSPSAAPVTGGGRGDSRCPVCGTGALRPRRLPRASGRGQRRSSGVLRRWTPLDALTKVSLS